jgi:thiamine pyrophosphate-dependent acetolactate synthase large subunit-like protein
LARAFEGHGEKVEDPRELNAALERCLQAVASGRLALLDAWLHPVN